jgi:12-oxophytodienoic acid reductase
MFLVVGEDPGIVDDFRRAARNAIEAFDGLEVHDAHGYLLEQFMKDSTNDRFDAYGGSLENRCRFTVEVIDAAIREVGVCRVGVRLSPFVDFLDCVDSEFVDFLDCVDSEFVDFLDPWRSATTLCGRHDGLLYCHMVEPRMANVDGWLAINLIACCSCCRPPGFEHGSLLLMKKPRKGLSPWFNIFQSSPPAGTTERKAIRW